MLEITDYELVQKSIHGDQDSFAELVTRYKKLVYSVVCYMIKNREDVDDISQEAFVKIFRSLGSYNPQFKFSTWSVTVTRNLCLDYLRKKKVQFVPIDEVYGLSGGDTPEAKYIAREKKAELRNAIDKLPEKYKDVVVLYHAKGASYKEMAEALDKPVSIIKNRLYRARLMLRDIIGAEPAI